jgi:hypothetical protein
MNRFYFGITLCLVVLLVGFGSLTFPDKHGLALEAQALNSSTESGSEATDQMRMVSDHFSLNWDVLANGGNTMGSSHFRLSSTLGQPAIGNASSPHFELRAGYWQNFFYRVYLPLVLRY